MNVSLPNGRTIDLPPDVYMSMTDKDYQLLVALGCGSEIDNPFQGSALYANSSSLAVLDEEDEILMDEKEELKALDEISSEEKLGDMDFDRSMIFPD